MGTSRSIGTDWETFDRGQLDLPVRLLGSILDRTAEAWLVVEPVPPAPEKSGWRKKQPKSERSITVSPYAEDDAPHLLLYGTFPKGPAFTDRGVALPSWATVADSSRDDVTVEVPIDQPLDQVVGLAMAVLDGCSDASLGEQWRAALGDTYTYNNPNY
jgi:hypothetical protein